MWPPQDGELRARNRMLFGPGEQTWGTAEREKGGHEKFGEKIKRRRIPWSTELETPQQAGVSTEMQVWGDCLPTLARSGWISELTCILRCLTRQALTLTACWSAEERLPADLPLEVRLTSTPLHLPHGDESRAKGSPPPHPCALISLGQLDRERTKRQVT